MKLILKKGSIIDFKGDAIVNCTNRSLTQGGGLDALIHRSGGTQLVDAYNAFKTRNNGIEVGGAFITTGGGLDAKYVIHAVGPTWMGGDNCEELFLANTYKNIFRLAEKHSLKSIAIPNISTGIFRFPKERAAQIALQMIQDFSFKNLENLYLYCFDPENYKIYQTMLKHLHK